MDGRYVFFIEFVLFATLALGFGVYQLWSVKRESRRAAEQKAAEQRRAKGEP